ncbi:uncharacterized protein N7484_003139 [Penicillium longicatenatum]|uniref:uncharacterized protein n=1 Tax=Penicillium longicatenatum TaxID=1561947 RepID=UPI002546910F|nr:uncharacterized protein N7484_003139 [Penicillium longicatenatum]KAJ5649416.1 hypothetical protein N7484_003139 [Penicillium longicatenatum]
MSRPSRDRDTKKPQHDSKHKTSDYLQKLEFELQIQSERERRQKAELRTSEHVQNYSELHEICAEYETKIAETEAWAKQREIEAGKLRQTLSEETKRADTNDWYIQQAEDAILKLEKAALTQRERASDVVKELQLRIHYGEEKTKELRELMEEVSTEVYKYKNQTAKEDNNWIDFYDRLLNYAELFEQKREQILLITQRMQAMIGLSEEAIQKRARLLQNEEVELDVRRSAEDAQIRRRKTVNDQGLVVSRVTESQKKKTLAVKEREKRENEERARVKLWKESRDTCTFWTDDDRFCSSPDSFNATIESAYDFQLPDPARQLPARMSHAFDVSWASERMDGVFCPPWPDFSPPISQMASLDLSDSDTDILTVSDAAEVPQFTITARPQMIQRKRVRFAVPDVTGLGGRNEIERPSLPKRSKSVPDFHSLHGLDLPGSNSSIHTARHPSLHQRSGKPAIRRYPSRAAIEVESQYRSSIHSGGTREEPLQLTSAPQIEYSRPSELPLPQEAIPPTEPSSTRLPSQPLQQLISHQYLEASSSHSARSQDQLVAGLPPRTTSLVQRRRGVGMPGKRDTRKKCSSNSGRMEKVRWRRRKKVPKSSTLPMPMPGMWPSEVPLNNESDTTKPRLIGHVFESFGGGCTESFIEGVFSWSVD